MEAELSAGDALYLPRGFVHSTATAESHSAHITIGINVLTWADMAREFVPGCIDSEEYREGLPPGFASRAELRPALRQRLAHMLPGIHVDLDALIDRAISLVLAGRRRIPARFRAAVSVITESSILEAPLDKRYGVSAGKDCLMLEFAGKRTLFSGAMSGILEAMCARETFRVVDLAAVSDTSTILTFARALQSIGFLRVKL